MLDGFSRFFQLAAIASTMLMGGSGGGAALRALRKAAARACNSLNCLLFGRRKQAIDSLALCKPPHLSLIMIPRCRSGSRSGLAKLLFRRRLPSLVFRLLCLSFRWMARCSSALRSNRLLSLRCFAGSFRLICCPVVNAVSRFTMSIVVMPVGCSRVVSRAFCVAAFSAFSSSCSRLAAFFQSLLSSLARAWVRCPCLCLRDGAVVVDWLGENRRGGWDCGRACWALSKSETCS